MSFLEKHSIQNQQDAIQFLKSNIRIKAAFENVIEHAEGEKTPIKTIQEILNAIKEIQEYFANESSWELEYWLGKGFSWCGERHSSIARLENAYRLSEGVLDNHIPHAKKHSSDAVDRNDIAFEIGESCLKVEHASYIEKATHYLENVFKYCHEYHPAMALLAECYFQVDRFMDAAAIAEEANKRLKRDSHWSSQMNNPKLLSNLMSKCYSREALKNRDNGEISKVVEVLKLAKSKGVIKPIDEQLLRRLMQQENILVREKAHLDEILLSKPVILTIRRELKNKFADITFDFEAIKQEVQRRLCCSQEAAASTAPMEEQENTHEDETNNTPSSESVEAVGS
ncbi:MAG: hypothetical protein AB1656_21795 [Candidatus Omnitrophota bacterium]